MIKTVTEYPHNWIISEHIILFCDGKSLSPFQLKVSILIKKNHQWTGWLGRDTWCPEKVLIGLFSPILQTCIILSVEHVANETLFRQSTSRVGPETIFW